MITQAYFEDIQQHIKTELLQAKSRVLIAVAWFTDGVLYDTLCGLAVKGISVEIILSNDDINRSSSINFEVIRSKGAKVWFAGDGSEQQTLMHNKFCIIDNETVLTGSYNWSYKAQRNHENITVIKENEALARQFTHEFNLLKEQYFGEKAETIDYQKLIIRLETLKNVILLNDKEDIDFQLKKLQTLLTDSDELTDIRSIIKLTATGSYGDAVPQIEQFVNRYKQITVYIDPETEALKLEIRSLELQVGALDDEKSDIEKLLHQFEVRHNAELGELLDSILRLRKEKLKQEAQQNNDKQAEYEEAENDYNEYHRNYENTKNEKIAELTNEQQKELKQLYRKASKLCHPDVVADEYQQDAERIFKELKNAYDSNNLQQLNAIYKNLEKGIFAAKSETITEKQRLRMTVNQLRQKRNELENQLNYLKHSETYQTVARIEDWNSYFAEIKQQLHDELNTLNETEGDDLPF